MRIGQLADLIYEEIVFSLGEHYKLHKDMPFITIVIPDFSICRCEYRNKQSAIRQMDRAEGRVNQLLESLKEQKVPKVSMIALSDCYPRPYKFSPLVSEEYATYILGARRACYKLPIRFEPIEGCVTTYIFAKSLGLWHDWGNLPLPSMKILFDRDYEISLTDVWEATKLGTHTKFDPLYTRHNTLKKANHTSGARSRSKRKFREIRAVQRVRKIRKLLLQAPSLPSPPRAVKVPIVEVKTPLVSSEARFVKHV